MELKDLFFADGKILEYQVQQSSIVMLFEDPFNTRFRITLTDWEQLADNGSVGFSLSKGKVTHKGDTHQWECFDDDGLVWQVRFKSSKVEQL